MCGGGNGLVEKNERLGLMSAERRELWDLAVLLSNCVGQMGRRLAVVDCFRTRW